MKKIVPLILFIALMGLVACENYTASTGTNSDTNTVNTSANTDTNIYITNTGDKYHRSNCRYLSQSKILISLEEAKARGYGPCSVCKP
jgi:hypothetical protein